MSARSNGIFTKEEFVEKFRFALSFYDHYITYTEFIRSKEFYANKALKISGLGSGVQLSHVARALMAVWDNPADEEYVSKKIESAWMHYNPI